MNSVSRWLPGLNMWVRGRGSTESATDDAGVAVVAGGEGRKPPGRGDVCSAIAVIPGYRKEADNFR